MLLCMNTQVQYPEVWPAIDISRRLVDRGEEVLSAKAMELLANLHRSFNGRRLQLLALRQQRQAEIDRGMQPDFLAETEHIRSDDWRVAPVPADLAARGRPDACAKDHYRQGAR